MFVVVIVVVGGKCRGGRLLEGFCRLWRGRDGGRKERGKEKVSESGVGEWQNAKKDKPT